MAWIGRDIYGLRIYRNRPYMDVHGSSFLLLDIDGISIKLPDDADKKLIGRELEIGDNPVELK